MPSRLNTTTTRTSRFGRAPRVVIPSQIRAAAKPTRTSTDKNFDSRFTRPGHKQRFKEVARVIGRFGDIRERICRDYATYSIEGQQFAVIKPLSDGGLRVGLSLEGDHSGLEPASGLGSSDRINQQFELASHEALNAAQLGYLRMAYNQSESVEA